MANEQSVIIKIERDEELYALLQSIDRQLVDQGKLLAALIKIITLSGNSPAADSGALHAIRAMAESLEQMASEPAVLESADDQSEPDLPSTDADFTTLSQPVIDADSTAEKQDTLTPSYKKAGQAKTRSGRTVNYHYEPDGTLVVSGRARIKLDDTKCRANLLPFVLDYNKWCEDPVMTLEDLATKFKISGAAASLTAYKERENPGSIRYVGISATFREGSQEDEGEDDGGIESASRTERLSSKAIPADQTDDGYHYFSHPTTNKKFLYYRIKGVLYVRNQARHKLPEKGVADEAKPLIAAYNEWCDTPEMTLTALAIKLDIDYSKMYSIIQTAHKDIRKLNAAARLFASPVVLNQPSNGNGVAASPDKYTDMPVIQPDLVPVRTPNPQVDRSAGHQDYNEGRSALRANSDKAGRKITSADIQALIAAAGGKDVINATRKERITATYLELKNVAISMLPTTLLPTPAQMIGKSSEEIRNSFVSAQMKIVGVPQDYAGKYPDAASNKHLWVVQSEGITVLIPKDSERPDQITYIIQLISLSSSGVKSPHNSCITTHHSLSGPDVLQGRQMASLRFRGAININNVISDLNIAMAELNLAALRKPVMTSEHALSGLTTKRQLTCIGLSQGVSKLMRNANGG